MLTRKKIFSVLGVLALIVGIYGYQEFTRENEDLSNLNADFRMEAIYLIKEFEANEAAANEKFLDKIVVVNGIIKDIIKDDKDYYTIMMGEKNIVSSVRCSIDRDHQLEANALQLEDEITIKGACIGFNADELLGSDVILNRCVIEKNKK